MEGGKVRHGFARTSYICVWTYLVQRLRYMVAKLVPKVSDGLIVRGAVD